MTIIVKEFNIKIGGKVVDTFVMRRMGGNHGDFYNNSGTLFDGDFFEGYRKCEKTLETAQMMADAGFQEVEIIK